MRSFLYATSPSSSNRPRNTSTCCLCASSFTSLSNAPRSLSSSCSAAKPWWTNSLTTSTEWVTTSMLRIVRSSGTRWASTVAQNWENSARRCSSLSLAAMRCWMTRWRSFSSASSSFSSSSMRAKTLSIFLVFSTRTASSFVRSSTTLAALCASIASTFSRSANIFLMSSSHRVLSFAHRVVMRSNSPNVCEWYLPRTSSSTAFSSMARAMTSALLMTCSSIVSWWSSTS
mmetsp:Transcript_11587/g.36011  ORF Transcript_11587/g.36011 Transcript_11587/m.36011 type:complete len:230 (-) Transcript_11587:1246-1935(-)